MFASTSRRVVRTAFRPRVRHDLFIRNACSIIWCRSNLTIEFPLLHFVLYAFVWCVSQFSRAFSEDAAKPATPTPPSAPTSNSPGRIAGFFSRVSSFLVGAGLTALVTQFYIFEELRDGNKIMLQRQKELEKRLKALEK